jgi:hypothetical protein
VLCSGEYVACSDASLFNEATAPMTSRAAAAVVLQVPAEEAGQRKCNTETDERVLESEPPAPTADLEIQVAATLSRETEAQALTVAETLVPCESPRARNCKGEKAGFPRAGETLMAIEDPGTAAEMAANISELVYQLSSRGGDGETSSCRIARLAAALHDSSSSSLWYTRCMAAARPAAGPRVRC